MTDANQQLSGPDAWPDARGVGVEGAAGDWWGLLVGIPWFAGVVHDPWQVAALGASQGRLLVMLRDPVARFATDPVIGSARASANASFQRGLYADALLRLWRVVPREQVLVLQQERCLHDTAGELARTIRFLGLEASAFRAPDVRPAMAPAGPLRDDQHRTLAREYAPQNRRLAALVPELDLDLWESAT
jgi:hypothetical protein